MSARGIGSGGLRQDGRPGRRRRGAAARAAGAWRRDRDRHAALPQLPPVGAADDADRSRFRVPIGDRLVEGRLWQSTLPGSDVPVYPHRATRTTSSATIPPRAAASINSPTPTADAATTPTTAPASASSPRHPRSDASRSTSGPTSCTCTTGRPASPPSTCAKSISTTPSRDLRGRYASIRTVFTIHNLAYQGIVLAPRHADARICRGGCSRWTSSNFTASSTSSRPASSTPTRSPPSARPMPGKSRPRMLGCGLHGVLMQRSKRLFGIVNGIDDRVWNPATDPHLAANYDAANASPGKATCKAALQQAIRPRRRTRARRCSAWSRGWPSRRGST